MNWFSDVFAIVGLMWLCLVTTGISVSATGSGWREIGWRDVTAMTLPAFAWFAAAATAQYLGY